MRVKYMQVKDTKLKIMEDRKLNILLVEDDEVDIMNVQRAFKKNNILNPLFCASNGLEALEMLRGRNGRPSALPAYRRLILLDLNMPKMGGLEFLQQLRADPALHSIPVVVLTTSDQDCDRMDAYKLNVAGYILKPVTFANFVEMMDALNRYWTFSEMI
jgi:CheY-like chemotaxis protein